VQTGCLARDRRITLTFSMQSTLFRSDPICNFGTVPGIDTLEILRVLTPTEVDMLFHQFMSKVNVSLTDIDCIHTDL